MKWLKLAGWVTAAVGCMVASTWVGTKMGMAIVDCFSE